MSANNSSQKSFGQRLWSALIRLLALITFLLLIGAITAGGIIGFIEIQRLANQVDATGQRVGLLRSDVDTLMAGNPDQDAQLVTLQTTISALESRLAVAEESLVADLTSQQEMLNTLVDVAEANSNQAGTLETNLMALNDALVALQQDINENGRQIDALGGEIDGVETAVLTLDQAVIDINEQLADDEALSQVEEAIALFRVWELISRARLRLLENNVGLAANDVESSIRTIDGLLALETAVDPDGLQMVQARLALAFASLPNNPSMANADLESAWDELDALFSATYLADLAVETSILDSTATPESTPETATPTPTSTPTPEP